MLMFSKRIVLHFPVSFISKPIVCKLSKDYNLDFTILRAHITAYEEGLLVLELTGEEDNYDKAFKYLENIGVRIEPLSQDIVRNEEKCTYCSVCTGICPTSALSKEPVTRKVTFDHSKCIACELCTKACPVKAMEVNFEN